MTEDKKEESKKWSKFNAVMIELEREGKALERAHELHLIAVETRDYKNFIKCYHVLNHAYVILKHAFMVVDRNRISGKLKKIKGDISASNDKKNFDPDKLGDSLFEVLDLIYSAKQKINLGIPIDHKIDFDSKIEEMV